MKTEPLDELETAAIPALQHAELVRLARDANLSPKRVQEEAISRRWPIRQAKAARSLAILRRDRGPEALEAFITRMEHARSGQPVTEHARTRTTVENKDRIRQSIARLTDNKDKLALMIKHGLITDAAEAIMALAKVGYAYFRVAVFPREVPSRYEGEVFFDTLKYIEEEDKLARCMKYEGRVCVFLASAPEVEQSSPAILDLEGLIAFLKWDREQTTTFVRCVIEKIITADPSSIDWRCFYALAKVLRNYLPAEDEFAKTVEIWLLCAHVRGGTSHHSLANALAMPHVPHETNELDPVIDRLLELGLPEEQVRIEVLAQLEKAMADLKHSRSHPQHVAMLAEAKCFGHGDTDRKRLLRSKYLPHMWTKYFVIEDEQPEWVIKAFRRLGRSGMWDREDMTWETRQPPESDQGFFRRELIKMIADGKVSKAYQILLAFETGWGTFYHEDRVARARKFFTILLHDAFALAFSANRYGVAAALVQTFGPEVCADETQLAAEAEQSVSTDDERQVMIEEFKRSRKQAISKATRLALKHKQPIRLDPLTYMRLPT